MTKSLFTITAEDIPQLEAVDDGLFDALLHQESGGKQTNDDGTPVTSRKGAVGIAQVMPKTAPEAAQLAGLPYDEVKYRTDAEYNKALGRAYFNKQLEDFGDRAKALAAYNAGPDATRRAVAHAERQGHPDAWLQYLPAETQAYVPAILRRRGGALAARTDAGAAPREDQYYERDTTPYVLARPIPSRSTFEAVADVALGLASGVTAGASMVASVAGADNPVAEGLNEATKSLTGMQSEERQAQRAARARTIAAAERSGSTIEEIAAFAGSFAEAPIETVMNAVGTSAPTLLTAFITGLAPATAARFVAAGAVGAVQGAGAVKNAIYEAVEKKLVEAGVDKEEAKKVAAGAQAYDSENGGQIALGAILGVFAGTSGAEAALSRILANKAVQQGVVRRGTAGAVAEAVPEGVQGGQERVASNIAEQNEGFATPTMRGVAGQATLEAMASAPLGGGMAAMQRSVPAGLEPVAEQAAQPDSPLSKAAIAGNTGPAADAARAAQDAAAQQVVAQENVAAQAEAKVQAQEQRQLDSLAQRSAAIADSLRQKGALDKLRAKDSPVKVQSVLNDLALAQSPNTDIGKREQALARLEYALEWSGITAGGAATPADQQNGADATSGAAPESFSVQQPVPVTVQSPTPVSDKIVAGIDANQGAQQANQSAATRLAQLEQEDGQAGAPADSTTPEIRAENDRAAQAANAAAAARVEQVESEESVQYPGQPPADAVQDSGQPREQVQAPRATAAALPGAGTAQHRKRRATLRQVIDLGLTTVEKRADGSFYLTNGRRDFKLDGLADAQLARREISAMVEERAARAADQPSDAQIDAYNFSKGEPIPVTSGLRFLTETKKGAVRRSKPGAAKKWETTMQHHYGDLEGTKAADGDAIDAFWVGSGNRHFVIDQVDPATGKYDEPKVMLFVRDEAAARAAYLANYEPGWQGLGAITEKSAADLKAWAKDDVASKKAVGDISGAAGRSTGSDPAARDGEQRADADRGVDDRDAGDGRQDAEPGRDVAAGIAGAGGAAPAPAQPGGDRAPLTIHIDGKKRQLQPVDPLAAADSPARGDRRKVQPHHVAVIRQIAAMVGKEVVFYSDPDGDIGDGFVMPGVNGTIFISDHTSVSPIAVFGHELFHLIRREVPAAHRAITKVVRERLKDGAPKAWRDDYHGKKNNNDNAPLNALEVEEIVSDLGGNLIADPTFWPEVMAQIQKDHGEKARSIIAQLAAKILGFIDGMVRAFRGGRGFRTDDFVNDLQSVRAAFRRGLADYIATQQGLTQAGMQAQILRAQTADARQSKSRDITQTEEFKRWFGDSKVVDADGKPLVVYHGTGSAIDEFAEPGAYEVKHPSSYLGTFFTTAPHVAELFYPFASSSEEFGIGANTVPTYLSIQNPFEITWSRFSKMFVDRNAYPGDDLWASLDQAAKDFQADLIDDGFDGIRIKGSRHADDQEGKVDSWVAFRPEQIKSAIGNNGDFDQANPDITRSTTRSSDSSDNPADANASPNDSSRRLGRSAAARPEEAPRYGKARDGAVSVIAHHFSTEPRERLDSAYYGRGLKDRAQERLGDADRRLRDRIYFYVDKGEGVKPEPGTGPHKHEVILENIYDLRSGLLDHSGGANAFEKRVIEAGFDGYLNPDFRTDEGAVVLLGKHNVPVQYIGMHGSDAAPRPRVENVQQPVKKALTATELATIEVGNIPGAVIKSGTLVFPETSREQANAEMERIGSAIRFSKVRAADAPADQYRNVEQQYRGTEQWLKAPNGAPTKLTERQWVHVRTPAFKAWFGDWEKFAREHGPNGVWHDDQKVVSKIVDENGEPMVVYHGSDEAGFDTFRGHQGMRRGALGIWLSDDWSTARSYVRKNRARRIEAKDLGRELEESGVYALFLNMRDPNEEYFEGAMWDGSRPEQYVILLPDENGTVDEAEPELHVEPDGTQYFDESTAEAIMGRLDRDGAVMQPAEQHWSDTDSTAREAMRMGNDGAIIREVIDDGGGPGHDGDPHDVFVAFHPNQVKSADFNSGEYSVSDNDIRLSKARRDGLRPEVVESAGPAMRYLTPAERAKLRVDTATKLYELFANMPSANEMAAVAHAGKAKRGWYYNSAQALLHVFGPDAPRFAALLAAMSPQTSVEENLHNTVQTWKNWIRAGRPQEKQAIFEIMGRSVAGNKLTDSVLPAWVPNSVRALTAEDPESVVLSGPKVNSFMLNLRGVTEEVTNDAWMANYAAVDQRIFSGSLNVAGTDPGKGPGYMAMSARVRQAAMRLNQLTGEDWTPAEVQETIWSWAKTLYELQTKDLGARELLENDAITDELIQATPDFRTQLHEERNEEALRQAGYAEAVDTLRTRSDYARSGDQGSAARSEAAPFDRDTQGRLLRKAASRLEQLRDDRAAAEALTRVEKDANEQEEIQRSATRDGSRRDSGRSLAPLAGAPVVRDATGPDPSLVAVAQQYAARNGIDLRRQESYAQVDPERAARIAQAYAQMRHAPQDQAVREAYVDLIRQTRAQYDALVDAGYEFTFFDDASDPYAGNPWNAMRDLRANKRMSVYGTYAGFGVGAELNIGLAVSGGANLDPQQVIQALHKVGADVVGSVVFDSDTEPTLVVKLKERLSGNIVERLARNLNQEAIAQRFDDGSGELYGPKADEWRPFNADYFLVSDGRRASEVDNPMMADTGLRWKDRRGEERPVVANDLFRAVHDAFGHGLEGAGFRADGEENAWQAHVRLFTGPAVGALTTETRGQNSWLNFGPYSERNRTAKVEDTIFAEQKTGLMPEWTWTEGRVGDITRSAVRDGAEEAARVDREVAANAALAKSGHDIDELVRSKVRGGLPTENSRGQKIHPDPQGVVNFWKWAGDTKVADEQGRPLVMYHQTEHDFSEFRAGSHFGTQDAANERGRLLTSISSSSQLRTMPVYLRVERPYEMGDDFDDLDYLNEVAEDRYPELAPHLARGLNLVEAVAAAGFDGVRYRNEVEGGESWITTRPDQVKSAIGNAGSFDPQDADITRSQVRDDEPQTQRAQPGANMKRLAGLLGPQLYGNMRDMGPVTVKELFQNSFDALKGLLEKGAVKDAKIKVHLDEDTRTITVTDNGNGMTPEIINKAFLTIAGTNKETDRSSGGFGIAKMLFLFGNEKLELVTVRDGVKSRMTATGPQLMESFDNKDAAPEIHTERTNEPSGTAVRVTLPATWRNPSKGEDESITFPNYYHVYGILSRSPLFEDIEVAVQEAGSSERTLNVGSKFPKNDFVPFAEVKFEWGSARIIIGKEEEDFGDYGKNVTALSNGLYQFDMRLGINPMEMMGPAVPRRIYLNLEPMVKPEEPGYPFALNRQSFAPAVKEEFSKILNYISILYGGSKAAENSAGFGQLQYVDARGNTTEPVQLAPKLDDAARKQTLHINQGDEIEIIDGRMLVNGREVPALKPEDIAKVRVDVAKFKIDQSEIDHTRPIIHDNVDVEINEVQDEIDRLGAQLEALRKRRDEAYDAYYKELSRDGSRHEDWKPLREKYGVLETEYDQLQAKREALYDQRSDSATKTVSITALMRERHGKKFDKYLHDIGAAFIKARDAVAHGDKDYADMFNVAVGVSFDKKYLGVNVRIPFAGMFLNPAISDMDRNNPTVHRRASDMAYTIAHEIAHHRARNHSAQFADEMQRVIIALDTSEEYDLAALKKDLRATLEKYADVYADLNFTFRNATVKNRGVRLDDDGNRGVQERDRDVAQDGDAGKSMGAAARGGDADAGRGQDAGAAGADAASQGDVKQSKARNTWYFSQLERAIEQVPDRLATMAAPQWKLWLDANAGKLGVKKDEIEWSGLPLMLRSAGSLRIAREEIAGYLRDHATRTEAIRLYAEGKTIAAVAEAIGMSPTRVQSFVSWAGINRTAAESRGVTDEKRQKVRRLYLDGNSIAKIQAKVGLSQSTIHSIVSAAGMSRSLKDSRARSEDLENDVASLYAMGLTATEVADQLGIGASTVGRIIREAGIARGYSDTQALLKSLGKREYSRGIQGELQSAKGGGTLYAASIYELARMHQLEGDPSVVRFIRSADRVPYGDGKTYTPDFEVTYSDGSIRIEEVKPFYMLQDEAVRAKAKAAIAFFSERGKRYAIITERMIGDAGFAAVSERDYPHVDERRIQDAVRSARWWAGELATAEPPDFGVPIFSKVRKSADVAETSEFKEWFGDSQVVDEDGTPRVVYHGTQVWSLPDGRSLGDFKVFDRMASVTQVRRAPSIDTIGSWFSTSPSDEGGAGMYGNTIYPVYLSIKKPWVTTFNELREAVLDLAPKPKKGVKYAHNGQPVKRSYGQEEVEQLRDELKSSGYDGIKVVHDPESSSREFEKQDAWIAFDPQQIKSAVGNDGTFSTIDGDITRSTGRTSTGAAWDSPSAAKWDDLVYKLQDKHVDTKRVVDAIREAAGGIQDDLNVYLQEELFHGRAAKRTEDFVTDELRPLVEQMSEDGLEISDVEEYLHARHAEEANDVIAQRNPGVAALQDGGSGMKTADARAYLAALAPDVKRKLDAIASRVDAIIAGTRQLYVDYELESQDTVDAWGQMFQHYVPLQREDKDGGPGIGHGFSIKGREAKGRTGSTRKVVDILANVAMQRERAIVRGEKNRVGQALVGLAAANPNEGFWTVNEVPTERVFNPATGVVEERADPLWKSRENTVVAKFLQPDGTIRENAVVFEESDERAMRMAAALKNLDAGDLEGVLGLSAKVTRYFASVNTQYNPVFGVVNLVRDVQAALLNMGATPVKGDARKIARNALSALRGIYADARAVRAGQHPTSPWAQLWEDFQKAGGQTGYRDLFRTSTDRAKAIESQLNPTKWMDSPLGKFFTAAGALKVPLAVAQKGAAGLFNWLSDYNLAMENGVRLAAYKAALDRGMSREQAASLAKNLTVNFNRKGQVGQQMGALYAFFNASMQGTARLASTMFTMQPGKPKTIRLSPLGQKIVYGGILLGSLQALALAAAGFGDDDPPEFVRERALIIPIGGKKYISIPMPLGYHVIPGLGRHATEFAMSGFKNPAKRVVSVVGMLADAFNPIGNAGLSMQTIAPTALDPLVALTENRDWTGKPIARTSMNKATPGHLLARDTASTWSRLISEGLNAVSGGTQYTAGVFSPSPDSIEYLLGQVTGGVGRELSKIEQSALAITRGEDLPTHKIPLAGRFFGDANQQSSQGSAFYRNVEAANKVETEIKGMRADGKHAEAAEYARRHPEALLIAMANRAERDVQQLRKQKRELVAKRADRAEVRAVEEKITAAMMRLNRAAEAIQARD